MSTESVPDAISCEPGVMIPAIARPPVALYSGDRMTREEFHRLYKQTSEDFKAELIGGIVYVASPVSLSHGEPNALLGAVLAAYSGWTPGVRASDNTTILLGDDNEPQPDPFLRVLPEYGGQTSIAKDNYVQGAPELVAETAYSSRAIDLHAKKDVYTRHGVREYLVLCVNEQQLRWFNLTRTEELQPDAAGVYRIQTFPGLWINGPALLAYDYQSLMQTLESGLAAPEHAEFVKQLAERRKSTS
jgi:Uma2 family endonuclease